jgi:hypothetical protein
MPTEEPFRVLVRKDSTYEPTITLRFNVADGMGQLSLKQSGRADPPLTVHYEEAGIDPELLRAARFVYNLNQQRQSFALSRLSPELCARLPVEQWTELKPVIEFGFRYLVIPEEALAAPAPVQVQVAASAPPANVTVPRPAPVRTADTPQPARPEAEAEPKRAADRPVPMEPSLAAAALEGLTREAAIGHLRAQLVAVEAMHQRIELLERKLASARSRERDLLAVLTRWQEREEPQ